MSGEQHNGAPAPSANPQHYCLRWNNHQCNLLGVLQSVLTSQQHTDVSLFCEGQVIRVHKLVLLASSAHFEKILEASPSGQQPFIILDGTRYNDLRALVDYMYRGEVNIEQEQLTSLLKTADNLKIKGLADVNKEEDDGGGGDITNSRDGLNSISPPPSSKRPKISPNDSGSSSIGSREAMQIEPRDLSRDAPRDPPANHLYRRPSPTPSIPSTNNITPSRSLLYSSSSLIQRSPKSPSPYFSSGLIRPRSPHYDPLPGSSFNPTRSSPQSPIPDHNKIAPPISMPPFGLPFTALLHESKKMHERSSHKMMSSHYDRERDDRDFLPPSWPPRGADHDLDMREREYHGRRDRSKEREWEKEKDNDRLLNHQQDLQIPQSQMYHLKQRERPEIQPAQSSPIPQPSSQSSLPRLEKIERPDSEMKMDEDKFSSSPDKDNSFSPPNEANSISPKTEYTPEGDHAEEDEDSSNGGSIREGVTSNGEITSTITSTGTNGRNAPSNPNTTISTNTVSDDKKVKCPYCSKIYRHQNNLRTHIRIAHKGIRIPCPICNRGFTRWFTVRCHIQREHQNEDLNSFPAQIRKALYSSCNE